MIAANYFDGRSARLHPVQLATRDGGIALSGDDIARVYPAASVTMAEPFAQANTVLYFNDGARCEVAGEARAALAVALGYRRSRVERWQERWPAALAALVLLLALLLAAWRWGVPAVADGIALSLPPTADKALGHSTLAALESGRMLQPSRLSDERIAQVQAVLRKVLPAHPRMPVRLLVRDAPRFGANALALPDGTIVITDLMVREIIGKQDSFSEYAEAQLAGVLAHELGHVESRHSVRLLARSSLTAALSAALIGDFSVVAAGVPAILMNMQHSREMEADADNYALATLRQRGLPSGPLADLFDDSAEQEEEGQAWNLQSYIGSHPLSAARSKRLRQGQP